MATGPWPQLWPWCYRRPRNGFPPKAGQLQNLFRQARDRYPGQQGQQREVIQTGKEQLLAAAKLQPRTTSPLERAIREYRRRTRSMDGFGSLPGASNFLRAWLVKENSRWAGQDWLETLVA